MRYLSLLCLFFGLCLFSPKVQAQQGRICVSQAEARHIVAEQKLLDPLVVMKAAVNLTKAEPLRSRLCRWNQDMVYEVSLLHRDGHVVHINMRALDGKLLGAR
jgi:hypothetical protein